MIHSGVLGTMQGRLVPAVNGKIQAFPKDNWREEFPRAAQCGLNAIEWIVETYGWDENPLLKDEGVKELGGLFEKHGVRIQTICADYFMEKPFFRATHEELEERKGIFKFLLGQAHKVGAQYINVPFVDNSEIRTQDELNLVASLMNEFAPLAKSWNLSIGLETSLDPKRFLELLSQIPADNVGVNYDIGNSASLGYDTDEEIEAYGDRIVTLHIKDRLLGGTTVPLGTGNADFNATFRALSNKEYRGPIVFQAAREKDELETVKRNVSYIKSFLKPYLQSSLWT